MSTGFTSPAPAPAQSSSPSSPGAKLAFHLQNGHTQHMDGRQSEYPQSGLAHPTTHTTTISLKEALQIKHLLLSILKGRIHATRTFLRPLLPRPSTVCLRRRRVQARSRSTFNASIILQPGKVHPQEVWRKLQVRLNLAQMGMSTIKTAIA